MKVVMIDAVVRVNIGLRESKVEWGKGWEHEN